MTKTISVRALAAVLISAAIVLPAAVVPPTTAVAASPPGDVNGDKVVDIVALDHDKNGLTDFVVLNGRGRDPGPIQLLAAFPGAGR